MANNNGFLLDTTILIDLFRGRQEAIDFLDQLLQEGSLCICSIVVAEIFSGVRPEELSKVEETSETARYCDAVVVGSALVKTVAERAGSPELVPAVAS